SGLVLFFFFQAEDGIRDFHVTGVQTCALPIWLRWVSACSDCPGRGGGAMLPAVVAPAPEVPEPVWDAHSRSCCSWSSRSSRLRRSEERRVGKECSCRRWADP